MGTSTTCDNTTEKNELSVPPKEGKQKYRHVEQSFPLSCPEWDHIPTEDLVGVLPIGLRRTLPMRALARRAMVVSLLKPVLDQRVG